MKKIFVIEDDEILRDNLVSLLELEDYKVYSSPKGKEGTALIFEIKPDLVLCDIMLPDTDGYRIIKELKSNEETRHIPFIFLTAKTEMRDLRNGMNLGADDYLTKPYDAVELINVVKTRIQLSQPFQEENKSVGKPDPDKISLDDHVFVKTAREVLKIQVNQIICILADAEYSEIITAKGAKILVRKLMKDWEQILPANHFIRIHKSKMININFLQKIEPWFNNAFRVHLTGYNEPLVSSRRYSSKIRSRLLT